MIMFFVLVFVFSTLLFQCVCLTEGECVVFRPVFVESTFIFHEINTHVPLSTLIAHMGKLQNRQLHFEFTSGRSVFYTKTRRKKK